MATQVTWPSLYDHPGKLAFSDFYNNDNPGNLAVSDLYNNDLPSNLAFSDFHNNGHPSNLAFYDHSMMTIQVTRLSPTSP